MLPRLSLPGFNGRRRFDSLNEQEILALAIASEEEDGRIYATYAEKLREGLSRARPRSSTAWPRRRTSIGAG